MQLTDCRKCHLKVSDRAVFCPHCGEPYPAAKPGYWRLFLFKALKGAASAFEGESHEPPSRTKTPRLGLLVAAISLGIVFAVAFIIAVRAEEAAKGISLPSVLFTASTLALTMLAVLFTVLGVIGWVKLRSEMQDSAKKAVQELREETVAYCRFVLGVVRARSARKETDLAWNEDRQETAAALDMTKKAWEVLQGVDAEYRWSAMNNLAFYMALVGDRANSEYAAKLALKLRERYCLVGKPSYLNTYATVVSAFPERLGGDAAVAEAISMMEALAESYSGVDQHQVEEANRNLHALRATQARLAKVVTQGTQPGMATPGAVSSGGNGQPEAPGSAIDERSPSNADGPVQPDAEPGGDGPGSSDAASGGDGLTDGTQVDGGDATPSSGIPPA